MKIFRSVSYLEGLAFGLILAWLIYDIYVGNTVWIILWSLLLVFYIFSWVYRDEIAATSEEEFNSDDFNHLMKQYDPNNSKFKGTLEKLRKTNDGYWAQLIQEVPQYSGEHVLKFSDHLEKEQRFLIAVGILNQARENSPDKSLLGISYFDFDDGLEFPHLYVNHAPLSQLKHYINESRDASSNHSQLVSKIEDIINTYLAVEDYKIYLEEFNYPNPEENFIRIIIFPKEKWEQYCLSEESE